MSATYTPAGIQVSLRPGRHYFLVAIFPANWLPGQVIPCKLNHRIGLN